MGISQALSHKRCVDRYKIISLLTGFQPETFALYNFFMEIAGGKSRIWRDFTSVRLLYFCTEVVAGKSRLWRDSTV